MKNTFIFLFAVLTLLILNSSLFIDNCKGQWQSDVRLTNAPDTSLSHNNNTRIIASNGSILHMVWWDKRDGNREIYYKRSTNGGVNWEQDMRLTNDPAMSIYPSVSVSGSNVHIVWVDTRVSQEIFYKYSSDDGITWGPDKRLTIHTTGMAASPAITVSGLLLHVFWYDNRDGNWEIYYKRSTDGGVNWGTDTRLTNNTAFSLFPSCEVSGFEVRVIWCDNRDGYYQVYYKISLDGGINWDVDTKLTNTISTSYFIPVLSVSGLFVHFVWSDNRDGNNEIYYKRSTDGGVTWIVDTRLTFDPNISTYPSIVVSGSNVHIVWSDNRDVFPDIFYKFSTDGGLNWSPDTNLTNFPTNSLRPAISISNSVLHVVWSDDRNGNLEIYYKRNPTGNVGIQNINSEIPIEYKLFQNYPNPFNPTSNIRYAIPKSGFVKLIVFDALGRQLETLVNESQKAGTYEVSFDGTKYPSGVYFYRIIAKDYVKTQRMVLVK